MLIKATFVTALTTLLNIYPLSISFPGLVGANYQEIRRKNVPYVVIRSLCDCHLAEQIRRNLCVRSKDTAGDNLHWVTTSSTS